MSGMLFKFCGIAVIGLALLLSLRSVKSDGVMYVRVALTLVSVASVLAMISPAVSFVRDQLSESGSAEYVKVLLKALGIVYLAFICSSVCRDCGEGAVADGVEAVAKVELILLSLPFLRRILQVMGELLGV